MTNMLLGRFENAWLASDAIRGRGAPDVHRFWQGEKIRDRRVMLRCLHGLGDAVQFLRFAPLLRKAASTLIVEVPPKLLTLAHYFDDLGEVITWGEQEPASAQEWDVQVEIMELPYFFRITVDDLPFRNKYLHFPQGLSKVSRLPGSSGRDPRPFHVGLMWTAGGWNVARSIPLQMLEPLFGAESCTFWNLQSAGEGTERISQRFDLLACMRVDEGSRSSIEELARLISQLDLVITVDTLAAHLAGALGIPAFVMLPYEADWRWMHDRTDSPWYPSLRLFRQPVPGDWEPVVMAVQTALLDLAQTITEQGIAASS